MTPGSTRGLRRPLPHNQRKTAGTGTNPQNMAK
jgi:hypothetical protein